MIKPANGKKQHVYVVRNGVRSFARQRRPAKSLQAAERVNIQLRSAFVCVACG
jgi:hypothetical protein